jgi:hypothetical protein
MQDFPCNIEAQAPSVPIILHVKQVLGAIKAYGSCAISICTNTHPQSLTSKSSKQVNHLP